MGLTEAGLPELVVTGLADLRSAELLNAVAFHYLHADPVPEHGDRIRLNDGPCLEVVTVPPPDAHLFVARNLYGDALRAHGQRPRSSHHTSCWNASAARLRSTAAA